MLRSIRFRLSCLKGKMCITAGHRPAAGSKAPAILPERQDYSERCTLSCLSGREWTEASLSTGHRPAVMKIMSFQDFPECA
ncbi:MAG: hypothetical protein LBP64_02695 [Tannerella sp.]|nr:hypothetical protein [Tannerella sp.]